jgi:hypothetical protein
VSKKLFSLVLLVLVAGLGLYAYLGGFNTPLIKRTRSQTYFIAGRYYAGPVEAKELGELFRQAARNRENKKLTGALANIYYNNPEKQTDSIKAFIGVQVKDDQVDLPDGYQLRQVPGGRAVVQATVKAHYLLSPKKLYPALFNYLKNNQLKTRQEYLEIFPASDQAMIQTEVLP